MSARPSEHHMHASATAELDFRDYIAQAVPTALRGAFQSCGQNCAGAERFLVHAAVYDRWAAHSTLQLAFPAAPCAAPPGGIQQQNDGLPR
jgi:acyl-CoA reductase-like NAD-dependent aldehyde dehydrogenase